MLNERVDPFRTFYSIVTRTHTQVKKIFISENEFDTENNM